MHASRIKGSIPFLINNLTIMLQRCIRLSLMLFKAVKVCDQQQKLCSGQSNELFSETDSKANHSPKATARDCRLFHYTCN